MSTDSAQDHQWLCYPCEKLLDEENREEHSNHFVEEANSVLRRVSESLKRIVGHGVEKIPDVQSQQELIDTQTDEVEKELSKAKQKLEERYRLIQAKLKAHHETLCQELDTILEKEKANGHHKKEIMQQKINEIESIRDKCINGENDDVLKALKTEKACKRLTDGVSGYSKFANEPCLKIPELRFNVTEDKIEKEVKALYGVLSCESLANQSNKSSASSNKKSTKSIAKVVTKPAFPAIPVRIGQKVSGIVQTSTNDFVVGYSTNKSIHYCDGNAKMQKSKELPVYVQSMTTTSSGAILVSENKGPRIMKTSSGHTEVFFDASPFSVHGILCSKPKGTVFVCCQSDKEGLLYVITSEGKLKEVISRSDDGDAMFLKPHRLSENPSNRNIFITDPGLKTLTGISKHHNIIFQYHGGPDSSNFIPIDVEFCPFNNSVIASNWKRNSVHLVSEEGQFLSMVADPKDNILYPTVMLLDSLKRLWVSQKGKITVLKCTFK